MEEGDTRTLKVKPEKVLKEELELCSNLNLKVSGRLTKPEAMIETARRDLDKKSPWNFGHDAGMVSCSRDMLDIAVSKGNVGRALRFMDALIKVLNGRGNKVIIENGETYAVLEDEKS